MEVRRLQVSQKLIDLFVRQKLSVDHSLAHPLDGHSIDLVAWMVSAAGRLHDSSNQPDFPKAECPKFIPKPRAKLGLEAG